MWAGRRERAGQESYERVSGLSVFPVQCPVDLVEPRVRVLEI